MATDTVSPRANPENPAKEIYKFATELQTCGSRIRSLAETISATVDEVFSEEKQDRRNRLLQNAINFADLIEREIGEVTVMGEKIETLTYSVREAA